MIRRKALAPDTPAQDEAPPIVDDALGESGDPLPPVVRAFFEERMGADFSAVRIVKSAVGARSAAAVGASAYTAGHKIVLGPSAPALDGDEGRRLLAHELAHVMQQTRGGGERATTGGRRIGAADDTHETHADALADAALSGAAPARAVDAAPVTTVQRKPDPSAPPKAGQDGIVSLKYVCFFVGHDKFGVGARLWAKTMLPEHEQIEATSMEHAFAQMSARSKATRKGGQSVRIGEIVLVSHGNVEGFLKIPLVKGHVGTSPESIGDLQDKFRAGALKQFQEVRRDVIELFDENTHIVVRGCRAGRVQESVDALGAFFGGQAKVSVPKEFQAFARRRIATLDPDAKQAAVKAFDHLLMQGLVPKELVFTDEEKVKWVKDHLPNGLLPESYFVDDAHGALFAHGLADDKRLDPFKDFASSRHVGSDKWGESRPAPESDADLDPLSAGEIVERATEELQQLRRLEREEPDARDRIGSRAWSVLRCHRAWSRKPEAMTIDVNNRDPMAGLYMPGLSYDTMVLSKQAQRRLGDTKIAEDAFEKAILVMPARRTRQHVEDLGAAPPAPAQPAPAQPAPTSDNPYIDPPAQPAPTPGKPGPSSSGPGRPHVVPEIWRRLAPPMPEPELQIGPHGRPAQKLPVARVGRGEYQRRFDVKYERQLGYVKVTRVSIELNGKFDVKEGEGEKELVLDVFGAASSKGGDSVRGGGDKLEATLVQDKDEKRDLSAKVTAGVETGGVTKTTSGATGPAGVTGPKASIYVGAQVGWGPIKEELKVTLIGYDESKSGSSKFTILGFDISPIVVQKELDIPTTDGGKVRFTGTVKLTVAGEPDWPRIFASVSRVLGRTPVVSNAAIAGEGAAAAAEAGGAGESIATGAGALSAGELAALGGGVLVTLALIAAYFRSIEDIEDLKELKRATDEAVADFCGGYLAAFTIPDHGGAPGRALWAEGQRHAAINLLARMERARIFLEEKARKDKLPLTFTDAEIRDAVQLGARKDAESWRRAVFLTYETAIRTHFYRAYGKRVSFGEGDHRALVARARAGLGNVDPNEHPDYSWINAVGANAARGFRLPAHRR